MVRILEVRQINVYQTLQLPQRLYRFIAAAVVQHWHRQFGCQCREYVGKKMGGRHQIDVLCALINQGQEDFPETAAVHRCAVLLQGNGVVLAEPTAKGTAGEKDRTRTEAAGYNGFLPVVEGGAGGMGLARHPAKTQLSPAAVHAAGTGTEGTVFIRQQVRHLVSLIPTVYDSRRKPQGRFTQGRICDKIKGIQ